MSRILAIARLQILGRRDGLIWPLVIVVLAFAVNLLVYAAISDEVTERPVTGGLGSVYFTALAFGCVAISQQFPFALGMSITRREFTIAMGMFMFAQSLVYATLLTVLLAVEKATDGWGLDLRFFGVGLLDQQNVAVQFVAYAVPMLLMSLVGVAFGAVYVRWKVNGVFATIGAIILVLGGAVALVTRFGGWPAVGDWLSSQSTLSLFAGWPLLAVILLGFVSWSTLRRATA